MGGHVCVSVSDFDAVRVMLDDFSDDTPMSDANMAIYETASAQSLGEKALRSLMSVSVGSRID
jgi:hypothetical protein